MQLHVRHETLYRYAEAVRYTIQALHLTPRREARQHLVSWSIAAPGRRVEQLDAHDNVVHYLTMEVPHGELRLVVAGVVETDEVEGQPNSALARLSPLAYRPPTTLTQVDSRLAQFAADTFTGTDPYWRLLRGAEAVAEAVRYRPGATQVTDPALTAFQRGEGVCQDQAQVFIACCRALAMPARYVSGYLLGGAGQVASHAWAEVWLAPANHWYGIDVTHRKPTGGGHCRLAVGRDYLDAAPVRGMRRGGGQEDMQVAVAVSAGGQQ
ncbi:MAG TPA: transglutaminase family protein [Steroidobacteraceae bacterium]|nr:transglutaminase family protein [Steroidobacteraceae bacterium]